MKIAENVVLAGALSVAAATAQAAPQELGIARLSKLQAHQIVQAGEWHRGCPVGLSQVRVVTYRYVGFDHADHLGQIVVNATVATGVAKVFRKLFALRFPIRDGRFLSMYGPHPNSNGDVTASFECRDAGASPCSGKVRTTNWSMHAFGEAIDLDPRENPYVGCGMTRDKTAISYIKRSHVRPGMVTPAIYRETFATIGWGWGGSWYGSTKDYMHFSTNGH